EEDQLRNERRRVGADRRRMNVEGAAPWPLHRSPRWPVYRVSVSAQPVQGIATVFRYRREPWPREGVFVADGWSAETARPRRFYDPIAEADSIIQDLSRTNAEDLKELLGFINRWGFFLQGEPWASVDITRKIAFALKG